MALQHPSVGILFLGRGMPEMEGSGHIRGAITEKKREKKVLKWYFNKTISKIERLLNTNHKIHVKEKIG